MSRPYMEPTVVHNLDGSSEYERQVALQSILAAILFAGEGIVASQSTALNVAPSLAQCVAQAKELVTMVEDSVGAVD